MKSKQNIFINHILSATLLLLLTCGSVFTYAANKNEYDISQIGVGAAIMGKGGWHVGQATGPETTLINPAGLGNISQIKGISMYSSVLKEYDYFLASGTIPAGRWGTFGLSYIGASTDADYRRDDTGNPLGSMRYGDSLMMLSWGAPLRNFIKPHWGEERVNIGASLKLYNKGWTGTGAPDSSAGTGIGLDLGSQLKVNRSLSVGAVWKNFFLNQVSWKNSSGSLPSTLKIGAAATIIGIDAPIIMGDQELTVGGDLDLILNDEGGMLYHIGAEYKPLEYIALRGGLDQTASEKGSDTNLTLGVGFQYAQISFDYAYHPYAGIPENDTHYFSMSYHNRKLERHYIDIVTPTDKLVTLRDKIVIAGKIIDSDVAKVFINEKLVTANKDNQFFIEVSIDIGPNRSRIIAVDEYGYVLELIDLRQLRLVNFPDITDDYWAGLPVRQLATLKLINGYPDDNFKPEGSITRAELTTILAKAREVRPYGDTRIALFNDLKPGHWAATYVNGGYALGLVNGYPDGGFRPTNGVSRAEGVALIARFDDIKAPVKVDTVPFSDVLPDHWVAPILTAAKSAGLLDYLKSAVFEDKKELTRAETVEILSKTAYVRKKLDELYNWDAYIYSPKDMIIVEPKEITADKEKLKIIDDKVEVQGRIEVVKVERKIDQQFAMEERFVDVTSSTELPTTSNIAKAFTDEEKSMNWRKKLAAARKLRKQRKLELAIQAAVNSQNISQKVEVAQVKTVEVVTVDHKLASVERKKVAVDHELASIIVTKNPETQVVTRIDNRTLQHKAKDVLSAVLGGRVVGDIDTKKHIEAGKLVSNEQIDAKSKKDTAIKSGEQVAKPKESVATGATAKPSSEKMLGALKGALLGRFLVNKTETVVAKEEVTPLKEVTKPVEKREVKVESIVDRKKETKVEHIDINISPTPATSKLYLKVTAPEDMSVSKVTVVISENNDTIVLSRRDDNTWAGVYYLSLGTKSGKHDIFFKFESKKSPISDMKKTFTVK